MKTEEGIKNEIKALLERTFDRQDFLDLSDLLDACVEIVETEKSEGNECGLIRWLDEKIQDFQGPEYRDIFPFCMDVNAKLNCEN